MAPYSMDLRERVAAAVDHREGSQREIARRFRVSLSFIVRLLQRRQKAGTLAPKPHGGGPRPALSHRDQQRLRRLIRKQNDATLTDFRQYTVATYCSVVICRFTCAAWHQDLAPRRQEQAWPAARWAARRRRLL